MQDLIDAFCGDYHVFHGISRRRALEQRSVLRRFEEFLLKRGCSIKDATADDLRAFLVWRIEEGQAPSMVRKMRNMIRPVFSWAAERGIVSAPVADAIQKVPSPQANKISDVPNPYSRGELDDFYETLAARWPLSTDLKIKRFDNGTSPYRSVWRHAMFVELHAMVGLGLYCGLRREEIFRVSVDDIDPINEFVLVQDGKGGEPREVPYPQELRTLIADWLQWRQRVMRKFGARHDAVWLALWAAGGFGTTEERAMYNPASPLGWSTFETLLRRRVRAGFRWHRFRHTCGTNWLRAGMELPYVSRLLGHSNLEQTRLYAKIVKTDVAREVARSEHTFHHAVAPRKAA